MKVGIIGFGYWGPNLVRNFSGLSGCTVTMVSDQRPERLQAIQKGYPNIETIANADDLIKSDKVDAVVIATPVFSHFPLAEKALLAGKHVLLEKPMTTSLAEAQKLVEIAEKKKLVLMVDHTFLYTGAVQKLKEIIEDGTLGKIQYFDSTRINLGLFQQDVNVLWDLAPHDISIMDYLVNERPITVQAIGQSHSPKEHENIAYLVLKFQSSLIAHFNCSWVSPVKIRSTLIGGDKKMVLFNDMEPTEKIKIYDTGFSIRNDEEKNNLLIDYRVGDIYIPKLSTKEALSAMAFDFQSAVEKGTKPISDWKSGLVVSAILEASQQSIRQNGSEVKIQFPF